MVTGQSCAVVGGSGISRRVVGKRAGSRTSHGAGGAGGVVVDRGQERIHGGERLNVRVAQTRGEVRGCGHISFGTGSSAQQGALGSTTHHGHRAVTGGECSSVSAHHVAVVQGLHGRSQASGGSAVVSESAVEQVPVQIHASGGRSHVSEESGGGNTQVNGHGRSFAGSVHGHINAAAGGGGTIQRSVSSTGGNHHGCECNHLEFHRSKS